MRLPKPWAEIALLALLLGLVLSRLSTFGIWDPWELDAADTARRLATGQAFAVEHGGRWLASLGLRAFGMSEWAGRVPLALCGGVSVVLAFALLAWLVDRKAACYGALIAATSPLLLFNARLMVGEAPTFAAQGLLALGGLLALSERTPARGRLGWLCMALAATVLAVLSRGALLGALPPLLAIASVALFDGRALRHRIPGVLLTSIALLLTALVVRDALRDPAAFSVWLGGQATGGNPPTFDAAIERTFHAFAPWSALLPLALASLMWRQDAQPEQASTAREDDLRWLEHVLLVWIALGYAAQTLYLSRYGREATFGPLIALSAACALFLRRVESTRREQWPLALAGCFLALLLVRDFALYPNSPVHGLPLASFKVPEVFNPRREWGLVLGLFAATTLLGFGAPTDFRCDLRAPYRFIAATFKRSLGHKAWLVGAALVLLALLAFGILAWLSASGVRIPRIRLSTQATNWGKRLLFLPVALPPAIAVLQLLLYGFSRLSGRRALPVLLAGLVVGGFSAHGFMPKLSAHFSPRDVYETYNALARKGEPLIEYRVGGRGAAYYAKGTAREVETVGALVRELDNTERRFAVVPKDDLGTVDRAFRRKTHRHLFVADARSARAVLVCNKTIKARKDQSPIAPYVLREAKPPQFLVSASFEDKVELIGYDLSLPHKDHVGSGESFEITWHFKSIKPVTGEYRVFVHIDGDGQRIHGDHDPVAGNYPLRLWDEGDIIVDRHKLDVPNSYRAGSFTIFMGLYSGETRLSVKQGPRDNDNRVRAGALRIQ